MNKLKEIRKQKGFTQLQIAEKVGIGLRSYQRYESGGKRLPDILTAIRMLDELGVKDPRKVWGSNSLIQL